MQPKEILYDRKVAGGVLQIIEIINDVFDDLDGVRWSSKRHVEYGFVETEKKNKTEIFCGIWYDAWQHFETPLCITVDYYGNGGYQKREQIEAWVNKLNITGVSYRDYEGFSVMLIEHEFFNFEDDADRLNGLFIKVSDFVESICKSN